MIWKLQNEKRAHGFVKGFPMILKMEGGAGFGRVKHGHFQTNKQTNTHPLILIYIMYGLSKCFPKKEASLLTCGLDFRLELGKY